MSIQTVSRSAICTTIVGLLTLSATPAQLTDPTAVVSSTNEVRPPYNVLRHDTVFDSDLIRISGKRGDIAISTGTFRWGSDSRHHYMTDNPWSRNGLYYYIENGRGKGYCSTEPERSCLSNGECPTGTCLGIPPSYANTVDLILDGHTFAPHNAVPSVILNFDGSTPSNGQPAYDLHDDDSWWDLQSGDDEDIRIAISKSSGRIFKYSAITGRLAASGTGAIWESAFNAGQGGIATGVSEGQSWDGNIVVVARTDLQFIQLLKISPGSTTIGSPFDVFTLPHATAPGTGSIAQMICATSENPYPTGCALDQVQVSASGHYVTLNYSYASDYTRVLAVDQTTLALSEMDYTALDPVPHVYSGCFDGDPSTTHSTNALKHAFIFDLAHSSNGRNPYDNNHDVLVGENHCEGSVGTTENGISDIGRVIMVDLKDATVTSLTSSSSTSVEANATHVSMLAYGAPGYAFVTYAGDASGKKFNEEIVRIKLSDHSVARFGRTHSVGEPQYRCESHGVPSPDGQHIAFASCWTHYCGTPCSSNCDNSPQPACGWADYSNRQDYVLRPHMLTVDDDEPE